MGIAQRKKVKAADQKFNNFYYTNARKMYLELAQNGYKSVNVLEKLGDTYYFEREKENAVEWYAELIAKYSDFGDEYWFRYAQSLKSIGLYDKAQAAIKAYYKRKAVDPGLLLKKSSQEYLREIESRSGHYEVQDVDYNSAKEDFCPKFLPDGQLIFTSNRYPSTDKKSTAYQPSLDIYQLTDNRPEKISGSMNTKFHESSFTYTQDRKTVYFARSTKVNYKNGKALVENIPMSLYSAKIKDNTWKSIKKLPFVNSKYTFSDPVLSSDEKKLFFTSNMNGSKGKLDLFAVEIKEDGSFGKPYNLGSTVNTLGNEIAPFVAANGDLYFASDTHFGYGGYDLFVSRYYQGKYQTPVNLGRPVNSKDDDITFIIDQNTKIGYFASNRVANDVDKKTYNLYKVRQKIDLLSNCGQFVYGKIMDADTNQEVSSCRVQLMDKNYTVIASALSDKKGNYKLELNCADEHMIWISKYAYPLTEKKIYTRIASPKEIELPVKLAKGKGFTKAMVYAGNKAGQTIELSAIYFDINSFRVRSDATNILKKVVNVLKSNPELTLKIRSYADYKGKESYNLKLSKKRAAATKNYIIKKGAISPNRIRTQALGESNPIVDCGKNCTEKENQINRRSEFVILDR